MAVTIPMTQGYVAIVDDEDAERVLTLNWQVRFGHGKTIYAQGKMPGMKTNIKMHQFILGKKAGMVIDHIDGNGLNNCKSNLRHCTNKENRRNNPNGYKNNSSGFTGVGWDKEKRKWCAWISVDGKLTRIGRFKTQSDAVAARKSAEMQYYKEYAPLNHAANVTVHYN